MGIAIGILHVRRSIFIQASPSRVWQEFETADRIRRWLDRGHTIHQFEPRIGGQVDMSVEMEGEQRHFGGHVTAYMPEQELSCEMQWQAPHEWPVPTFWTIRLTAIYDGTQVEILHHGFERLGAMAADQLQGYEGGWDIKHLKALRAIVDG